MLGAERSVVLEAGDRRRTGYHESGHALVGMLTPGADPERKTSIIPRGMRLGVTLSAAERDRFSCDRESCSPGLRSRPEAARPRSSSFGKQTTGAESDIRQATELARNMVGRFGMSDEIGFVSVLPADGDAWSSGVSQISPD